MATTKTKKNKADKAIEAKDNKGGIKSHPLIVGPRITEKSALLADKNIYTFNVARNANKMEIKKAIKLVYNVTPVRIAIVQIAEKVVMRRGVVGKKSGGKKAIVHLKKGDKIAFA